MDRLFIYNRGSICGISRAEELISDLEKNIYEGDAPVFILVKRMQEQHRFDIDIYKIEDYHIVNLVINNHNTHDPDRKLELYYGIRNQRFRILKSNDSDGYSRPNHVYAEDSTYRDAMFLIKNTVDVTLHY